MTWRCAASAWAAACSAWRAGADGGRDRGCGRGGGGLLAGEQRLHLRHATAHILHFAAQRGDGIGVGLREGRTGSHQRNAGNQRGTRGQAARRGGHAPFLPKLGIQANARRVGGAGATF